MQRVERKEYRANNLWKRAGITRDQRAQEDRQHHQRSEKAREECNIGYSTTYAFVTLHNIPRKKAHGNSSGT
jgi:hypothetical protein